MSASNETAEFSAEIAAKRWLREIQVFSRPWAGLAIVAGLLQGLAIVVQCGLMAYLLQALIMEKAAFSALTAPWLALPLVFALRALASWAKDEAGSRASAQVRTRLREQLLDKVHALGPAWRATQAGGALVSKLLEQVDAIDGYMARYRPQMILAAAVPLMILIAAFAFNWAAGLILLVTAPLIPVFMTLVGMGAKARQTRQLQALSRMSGHFLDLIRGMGSLRLVDAHRAQTSKVEQVAEDFRIRTMSVLRIAFLSSSVLEFFTSVAIAITAVYFGFSLLGVLQFGDWQGKVGLGSAFFILLLAPEFYWPLRELGTHYHARAEALAAAGQLMPILQAQSPQPVGGAFVPANTAPAVRFEQVAFAHVPGVPVLQDISLAIRPGEKLAVVGASGAGKTTLLRLLLGQLSPTAGAITIDNQNLANLDLAAWRERIGWMGQHPRLIAASLADNLRVARHEADDAALQQALAFAGLQEWFAGLPQGLATPLGEGGRQLSGGQLRRLALARVWLRDAPLLLLDEPTASLDHETEAVIMAGLATLSANRTVVMLTHRAAPMALMDRIVLLRQGHIAASANSLTGPIAEFFATEGEA
ncbi:thiol reductant ABC exporter subunit CydD [Propionivibrio limicola]|uniref:thiol reductant ABC exporter subunit CydD n=1 Tax=Propionivibrio limicola TaxID=167645 RepID=UPI001291B30B|nr:thiol reductant ABC exporter subunit CydD [Propionivibrio limicola]